MRIISTSVSINEKMDLLEKKTNELKIMMIPIIVFVSFLIILGVFGNSTVMYFYRCKTRTKPNTYFIVALTVFDLLTCVLGMPMDLTVTILSLDFNDETSCKILRFLTYFTSIASALILVSLAIDRYRRICQPLKHQLSVKQVIIACILCAYISALLSWPALVLFVADHIKNTHLLNITGHVCQISTSKSDILYVRTFHILHSVCFVILTVTLFVIYALIVRELLNVKRRFSTFVQRQRQIVPLTSMSISASMPSTCFSDLTDLQSVTDESNLHKTSYQVDRLELSHKIHTDPHEDHEEILDLNDFTRRGRRLQVPSARKCRSELLKYNTKSYRTKRTAILNSNWTNSHVFDSSRNRTVSRTYQTRPENENDRIAISNRPRNKFHEIESPRNKIVSCLYQLLSANSEDLNCNSAEGNDKIPSDDLVLEPSLFEENNTPLSSSQSKHAASKTLTKPQDTASKDVSNLLRIKSSRLQTKLLRPQSIGISNTVLWNSYEIDPRNTRVSWPYQTRSKKPNTGNSKCILTEGNDETLSDAKINSNTMQLVADLALTSTKLISTNTLSEENTTRSASSQWNHVAITTSKPLHDASLKAGQHLFQTKFSRVQAIRLRTNSVTNSVPSQTDSHDPDLSNNTIVSWPYPTRSGNPEVPQCNSVQEYDKNESNAMDYSTRMTGVACRRRLKDLVSKQALFQENNTLVSSSQSTNVASTTATKPKVTSYKDGSPVLRTKISRIQTKSSRTISAAISNPSLNNSHEIGKMNTRVSWPYQPRSTKPKNSKCISIEEKDETLSDVMINLARMQQVLDARLSSSNLASETSLFEENNARLPLSQWKHVSLKPQDVPFKEGATCSEETISNLQTKHSKTKSAFVLISAKIDSQKINSQLNTRESCPYQIYSSEVLNSKCNSIECNEQTRTISIIGTAGTSRVPQPSHISSDILSEDALLQENSTRPTSSQSNCTSRQSGSQPVRSTMGTIPKSTIVILFVIPLLFVLSFMPYLSLSVWLSFQEGYEVYSFTECQLVALNFGFRSYFINCSVNPLIYGFFNSEFRKFIYRKIFCRCQTF